MAENGTPTQRYHDYRNASKSKQVLGDALKEAYREIFHLNEKPSQSDKAAITGLFKSTHNVSDQVANFMANTFLSLLYIADISGVSKPAKKEPEKPKKIDDTQDDSHTKDENSGGFRTNEIITNLRYNIEIHLPATKDIEVYNSIFKSLREHLLNE